MVSIELPAALGPGPDTRIQQVLSKPKKIEILRSKSLAVIPEQPRTLLGLSKVNLDPQKQKAGKTVAIKSTRMLSAPTRPKSPGKNNIDSTIALSRKLLEVETATDINKLMAKPGSTSLLMSMDRVKKNRAQISLKETKKSWALKEINKTKGILKLRS